MTAPTKPEHVCPRCHNEPTPGTQMLNSKGEVLACSCGFIVQLPERESTLAAARRVKHFLDAWQSHSSRGDLIYGLGVHREDETRDLLASDLRLLLSTYGEAL